MRRGFLPFDLPDWIKYHKKGTHVSTSLIFIRQHQKLPGFLRYHVMLMIQLPAIALAAARWSKYSGRVLSLAGPVIVAALVTACSFGGGPPSVTGGPPTSTPSLISVEPEETTTPTPVPRILTICTGAEPDNLSVYAGLSLIKNHILEAIYDGPIDSNGFDFQPVILEKLPDLADGDAAIEPVPVEEGDEVVNDAGQLVLLAPGEIVRPFGCYQPGCALRWEGGPLEMAELSATFTLLDGLRWSDGTPLQAADSVASFEIARKCQAEPGSCGGSGLVTGNFETAIRTANYSALDERSLRWTGVPGFLDPDYRTNFFVPLPAQQVAGRPVAELYQGGGSDLPLGWGSFALDRWVPGDHIRLQKNPHYFRAGEGLPRFDILIFRFVGQEPEQNLAALSSGTCDVLDQEASAILAGERLEDLLALDESGQLVAHFTTGTVWEHADFGIQHISYDDGYHPGIDRPAFFNDARTRQAIALCMDRQQVVDRVLHGLSVVPNSYLPPEHPLFNQVVARYPFDPQAGQALLDQVGWLDDDGDSGTSRRAYGVPNVLDGTPLAFTYLTSTAPQRQQAARILQESLSSCGIEVDLDFQPAQTVFAEGPDGLLFGRSFEMAQFSWLTGFSPPCDLFVTAEVPGPPGAEWFPFGSLESRSFLYGWGGQNLTGFSSPAYDQACQSSREALPGQAGYIESHYQAQELFATELPVVPLYLRPKIAVTRPDICGFQPDPTAHSEMWAIEVFDVGDGCN
jgi:peptide/nickel transport system substrate-binding protein